MTNSCRFLVATVLAVMVLFAAANMIWMPASNITLNHADFGDLAKIGSVLLLSYASVRFVDRRLMSNYSIIARIIRHSGESIGLLILSMALFVPLLYVSTVFMYAASATHRPLVDMQLAALDTALGFDWIRFLEAANSSSIVSKALVYSYHSLALQVPLVGIFLSVTLRAERLLEFTALFAVSLLLSCLLMAALPAAGAYAYFRPPAEVFSNFTEKAGIWHLTHLDALRSGEPFRFSARTVEGLVTFPSFHTTLGILAIYAFRGFWLVAIPLLIVNVLMIIGTMPEGGHHLVDVIAGIAVAVISIALIGQMIRYCRRASSRSAALGASANPAELSNV